MEPIQDDCTIGHPHCVDVIGMVVQSAGPAAIAYVARFAPDIDFHGIEVLASLIHAGIPHTHKLIHVRLRVDHGPVHGLQLAFVVIELRSDPVEHGIDRQATTLPLLVVFFAGHAAVGRLHFTRRTTPIA
jgi:hypothetical protein